MLSQLIRYSTHRYLGSGSIRLAMTILVKNEADIIADNIKVHARLGVDCFIVMDNGSTDGTREILETLKSNYDLHIIDQTEQTYRQRQWMTQLAFLARDEHGADWVISNDADEFWLPKSGDLKQDLNRKDSSLSVPRHNMLLTEASLSPGYHYYDSTLRVDNPIHYSKHAQRTQLNISLPLVSIKTKVMTNPYGLIKIKGGNHSIVHIANLISKRESNNIAIYHYPIRTYEQFEKNIINRVKLAKLSNIRMGDHYFRWVNLYEQGKLEEEYQRFIIKTEEAPVLERLGIVTMDTLPNTMITSALFGEQGI